MSKRFLVPLNLPGGSTLPSAASVGDLFFKSDEQAVYVNTSTGWAELAGGLSGLAANRVIVSDGNGEAVASSITNIELDSLSGVDTNIQAQLEDKASTSYVNDELSGKADTVHTHTIANVTDLQTTLNAKAPIASPTLTGTVAAPQIRLSNTTAASTTSTAHGLQVGSTTTGTRMKLGSNTLQVVTSTSSATTLELQPNGGFVRVGSNIDTDVAQATTNGTPRIRNIRLSTGDPSGGLNGDVWLKYE